MNGREKQIIHIDVSEMMPRKLGGDGERSQRSSPFSLLKVTYCTR